MKIFTLRTQISTPFDYFRSLGSLHGRLTQHKAWELEHNYYSGSLFDLEIEVSYDEDHAGLTLALGLLGYGIHFRFYDTRHYDTCLKTWEKQHYD